jgi:L-lactate dehydrogenase complex protein LldE
VPPAHTFQPLQENVRVALFATCLVNEFHADAALAAARLLRSLGVQVDVPAAQTCCGQPAYNAGHREEARRIARHTLGVFEDAEYVVLPSGSCTAMICRHYTGLLERQDAARAAALAARTFELTRFIVRILGITDVGHGLRGRRIAWHPGCHAMRELDVRDEPLTLLRNAGAEILEWEAAQECCGFGGLFSVKFAAVSAAMADRKIDTLPATPDALVSGDAGCLLQLGGRLSNRGIDIPVRHIAGLLMEAAVGES